MRYTNLRLSYLLRSRATQTVISQLLLLIFSAMCKAQTAMHRDSDNRG